MTDSSDNRYSVFQRLQNSLAQYSENAHRNLELLEPGMRQARLKNPEKIQHQAELFEEYYRQPYVEIIFRKESSYPPQLGEQLLLLILRTKDERINIPGDLAEEYGEIKVKHGARFAKVWYYKQVAASAWPMIRKALRFGLYIWIGEWIRQRIK